ncbi:MAG: hypothetical protein MI974_19015 [Chitinophagales bacterium]|nr:hypothetical protein [Chitinophagales bacterium]
MKERSLKPKVQRWNLRMLKVSKSDLEGYTTLYTWEPPVTPDFYHLYLRSDITEKIYSIDYAGKGAFVSQVRQKLPSGTIVAWDGDELNITVRGKHGEDYLDEFVLLTYETGGSELSWSYASPVVYEDYQTYRVAVDRPFLIVSAFDANCYRFSTGFYTDGGFSSADLCLSNFLCTGQVEFDIFSQSINVGMNCMISAGEYDFFSTNTDGGTIDYLMIAELVDNDLY